jgi:hypothetical protein
MGWVVNTTSRPLYPGKDPVPIVYKAGWAPGPVWLGAENLVPIGFRSPDRSARSQLLYRLSYPGLNLQRKMVITYRRFGTTFRVPSSKVKQCGLSFEDGAERSPRNYDKRLPFCAAKNAQREHIPFCILVTFLLLIVNRRCDVYRRW